MADRVRLQVITENNPETWADVGPDGINLPVDVRDSVLPDGAATSEKQTDGSQKTQVVDKDGNSITSDDNKLDVMAELIPVFRSLLLAITNPSYVDKSENQMRSQVTGSLTQVMNLINLGSFPANHLQRMNNMTAWATNIRSLIT